MFFVIVAAFIMALIVTFCDFGRLLFKASDYEMYSSAGKNIKGFLYFRNIKYVNDEYSKQIVIIFDKSIGVEKDFDVLVLVPKYKFIGVPEFGSSAFKYASAGYVYQTTKKADFLISADNNTVDFDDPPIKFARFSADKIVFNCYGKLKQFGDSIIIEKKH